MKRDPVTVKPVARIGINALYLIPGGVGGTEIYLRELLQRVESRYRFQPNLVFRFYESGKPTRIWSRAKPTSSEKPKTVRAQVPPDTHLVGTDCLGCRSGPLSSRRFVQSRI